MTPFIPGLMELPPHVREAAELRARLKRRGHAGQPGSGPGGETCRTCRHLTRHHCAGTYLKCGHRLAPRHTSGSGTDIRAKDPACNQWEPSPSPVGSVDSVDRRRGKGACP